MKTVISVNFIFRVFCISYFLIMVVKTPHNSNRKEGFILAYTLLWQKRQDDRSGTHLFIFYASMKQRVLNDSIQYLLSPFYAF